MAADARLAHGLARAPHAGRRALVLMMMLFSMLGFLATGAEAKSIGSCIARSCRDGSCEDRRCDVLSASTDTKPAAEGEI